MDYTGGLDGISWFLTVEEEDRTVRDTWQQRKEEERWEA